MTGMRAIILAAGQGYQLDGMSKCLIRDPRSGDSILEHQLRAFAGKQVTVVVGYRAVEIMQRFPSLDFVLNPDWATTHNSYSLSLAVDERPSYVVSSDLLFEPELVAQLDGASPDLVLTERRENRISSSIHCRLDPDGTIAETYVGPLRRSEDPEAIGLFKISSVEALRRWRANCRHQPNVFVGQNLPLVREGCRIHAQDLGPHRFFEVNNASDYLRLIEETRGRG